MAGRTLKSSASGERRASFVLVGGGIAGVTCAEQLALEMPHMDILLISSSPLIKAVVNVKKFSRVLEEFDVEEKPFSALENQYPNVYVIAASVVSLDSKKHEINLSTKEVIVYDKLCLCSGAIPKKIIYNNSYILGIRDTETIQAFQKKLADSRRVIVVGNGGIATELVYEIENCQVIWAIKDKSIGSTFFDAGAAEFFLPSIKEDKSDESTLVKRTKYTVEDWTCPDDCPGSALGPDWSSNVSMKGIGQGSHNVHIELSCEVQAIHTSKEFCQKGLKETELNKRCVEEDWPIYVELTNGSLFGCDFVLSATGVEPNIQPFLSGNEFLVAADGGLQVDDQMRSSVRDIYAAGDVCTASWTLAQHWFQMRLWTQARQMGAYAAKCMSAHIRGETPTLDICFELFTHVTRFFGYKVVLLGLFKGQGLGQNCELLLRMTKRQEFVKVILQEGRMQGAILIGETDLEETFENLILNQLDLSPYGEDLLNPDIDIEDYFD